MFYNKKIKFKACKRLETKGRQERREEGRGEKERRKEWTERKGRKEDGRERGNGRKKREMGRREEKRCQKERKQSKKGEDDEQDKNTAMWHNFPAPRPLSPGAWPARDVSAPRRPRRPRPSVVKSPGTLVAPGRVGRPRSLGGCESLGLWPLAQAAPAAGQGGNCPETRRLSGRVVQGCASRTRGGGSHARLRARGLSASVLAGTLGRLVSRANAAGARRGHAKMLYAIPVCPPSVSSHLNSHGQSRLDPNRG